MTAHVSEKIFVAYDNELLPIDKANFVRCLLICSKVQVAAGEWQILVNTVSERLHLIKDGNRFHSYAISSATKGTGQIKDSFKIPLGLHYIAEKIGDGAGEIFKYCQPIEKETVTNVGTNSFVARILRLAGLEEQFNKGKNAKGEVIDSFDRRICIYGTNAINALGKSVTRENIRMSSDDIIDLYANVPEKTVVYIY